MYTLAEWTVVSLKNRTMLCRLLTAAVLLLGSLCGRAHCQRLMDVNMDDVAERLGERFQGIRRDALGAQALEAEYNRVGFTFSELEATEINNLLANTSPDDTINSVLTLFNTPNLSPPTNSFSIAPTTECCGIDLTGESNPQACCHSCNTTSFDENLLTSVAEAFRDAGIPGVELELGLLNGTLLRFPASQPSADCSQVDARLLPWFIEATRARPREVVLLLDLNDNFGANTRANFNNLRIAARTVLNSLTVRDKVGVVAFGDRIVPSPTNAITSQVVPVCSQNQAVLDTFIRSIDNLGTPGNYTAAFPSGFSLFTNDTNTDKLLLFFTDGVFQFRNPDLILGNVTEQNQRLGNSVVVSTYRVRDQELAEPFFQSLINQPIPGALITETSGESVAEYYLPLLNETLLPTTVFFGRTSDSNGADALSIATPYFQDSALVGVFHAALPWQLLFSHIAPLLSNRDSSYVYMARLSGQALYHPLFPGNSQSDIRLIDVEGEDERDVVLARLQSQSQFIEEIQKDILVHTGSSDGSSIVLREVPTIYTCRVVNVEDLFFCLVLAEEEVESATLRAVNSMAIYGSSPSARQPIYHVTSLSVPAADQCNYFCRISTTDRISYQLTSPSLPPPSASQESIMQFAIEGVGPTPEWAEDGLPSDIAVSSIVSSYWLNRSVSSDDYITRRHLATPIGTYLTYPPIHLDAGFLPRETEWYQAAASLPSTLVLTPPREDPLLEGGLVYSVAYALRAPSSESGDQNSQVLSVVAADITFASLRVIVEEVLPQCTLNSFSCFIVDSVGNLVYHRSLFEDDDYTGNPPTFFARDLAENRVLLSNLLSEGAAIKEQCGDYFDSEIRQRIFYTLNLASDQAYSSFDDGICVHYTFHRIPGTNAFFAVLERRTGCNIFCLCSAGIPRPQCIDCSIFQAGSCECPCVCNDDCIQRQSIYSCPRISDSSNLRPAEEISAGEVSRPETSLPPYCFNQECGCRTTRDSCLGVRECHWCEQQQSCIHITECCDEDLTCCIPGITQGRFTMLPLCLEASCFVEFVTPPTVSCPSSEDNTAVIAGVVGGLVGLTVVVLFLVFILWYQFCRGSDYEEEDGKENAFDFIKKRTEAVNISTASPVDQDIEKSDFNIGSGAASRPSDETIL